MAFSAGTAYQNGRHLRCRLPNGADLIDAVITCCRRQRIKAAVFSLSGTASTMVIGTYDQKQQVYVTCRQTGHFQIVFCSGEVSLEPEPTVAARLIAADVKGALTGGRLFDGTTVHTGQIDLQELIGPPLVIEDDVTIDMKRSQTTDTL